MIWARRQDGNHSTIVSELQACGYSVLDLSRLGGGAPDLLVAFAGHELLVELKDPDSQYGKCGLQAHQAAWARAWRGTRPIVATCAEDVIGAFNAAIRAERERCMQPQGDYR